MYEYVYVPTLYTCEDLAAANVSFVQSFIILFSSLAVSDNKTISLYMHTETTPDDYYNSGIPRWYNVFCAGTLYII